MPTKLDLKHDLGALYKAKRSPALVELPELRFPMVDGSGDPNSAPEWVEAIETLYSASYNLKFMLKRADAALDYAVMPLEALWSSGSR